MTTRKTALKRLGLSTIIMALLCAHFAVAHGKSNYDGNSASLEKGAGLPNIQATAPSKDLDYKAELARPFRSSSQSI